MAKERIVGVALRIDLPYPNYQDVLGGVRRYASERPHWRCVVDPQLTELKGRRRKGRPPYDGVIARASHPLQRKLRPWGIPFVNTLFGTARPGMAGVYTDVAECGRILADHFHDRGFRRLAYLGPPDEKQVLAIGRAFVAAAADWDVDVTVEMVNDFIPEGKFQHFWQSLARQLERFMDDLRPPVGVLVAKAWIARFLITLCERRGWHIPQELAVVSMQNVNSVLELSPQITCLNIDHDRVGYEAAALLDRMMDDPTPDTRSVLVPPMGVTPRESTDHFAVEDPLVAEALRFIDRHLREPLTVDRVAEQVTVSPSTLQRRFDQALGRGVGDEVRRLRIELAKRLLRDEQLPIGQVAWKVGFGSRVTLNNIFSRELGISPSQYREQVTIARPSRTGLSDTA